MVATDSWAQTAFPEMTFRKGVTRLRRNHPAVKLWPGLFKPIGVTYPTVEQATASPGEKRG